MSSLHRLLTLVLTCLITIFLPKVYAATVPTVQLTSALHWRSVGPYVGGRVTSLAGIPGQPNVFYMATAGGGVWESDDYGQHWENISGKYFKTGATGAIAVSRSNPKIIYVGAGDSAPRNTFLPAGGGTGGVYKSIDGGKTWSRMGLEETNVISWILIDPNNPDVVYIGALGHVFGPNTERGVYKTTDGGETWKKVLYVNDDTGVITMAMDPSNPQVVYAAMWQVYRRAWTLSSGGPGSGIYKTTDGGEHWTNITHNPGMPTGIFGKIGIAVAPSNPSVVYALAQTDYKPGHPGALFRSDNGGQTWQEVNDSLKITQRAFYYIRVYVDPKDANTIYMPNVGVYVSHDGGKSLIALHPPHGDNHAFWINPDNPQVLIEGNDGGATVSLNGGKSWSTEDNQPTGQFYHANLDNQFPFHIYGAQQDEGSAEAPSAVRFGKIPPVWTRVAGGEMSWVVPTPDEPWITYGSGYYSQEERDNRRTNVTRNVNTWGEWKFGTAADGIKYRYGWWYHPKVFDPHNSSEFLIGANVLFETQDAGINWKVISPDLTRNDKSKQQRPGGPINADVTGEETYDTISAVAFSPMNDQIIWVGSDDGLVHLTTDGGAHWSQVRPPKMPTWSFVTGIAPSHAQEGTAYVSASRDMWDDFKPYVYKTTDYGKHWTEITMGLPDNQYINGITQDPGDPNVLFVGTSSTVYMSLDAGTHWQPLTLNLPPVRVTDVAIQSAQHAVVISTFGRAYWVLDNLQFLEQLGNAQVASDAPYLFKPQQTWLVTRRVGGFGSDGIGGDNLAPGVTVFFHLPADFNSGTPVKLSFTDESGKDICSFSLPIKNAETGKLEDQPHAGMNRFLWDLRYPNGVDINGIYAHSQGALPIVGPEVVPDTYYVTLNYNGSTQKQSFVVKLDPRLTTTQPELQQRFDLLMRLRDSMTQLDTTVNKALDARSALEKAVASNRVSKDQAQQALAALNRDIDSVVDLRIQTSEGSLVYAAKLRAWMSWLARDVMTEFVAPTPTQMTAAATYFNEQQESVRQLTNDVSTADAVLKR